MNINYQQAEVLTIQSKALAKAIADQFGIGISIESHNTHFSLVWTDFVANTWEEEYDDLSEVILRLALLVRICEREDEVGFTETNPLKFARIATRFFAEQLR